MCAAVPATCFAVATSSTSAQGPPLSPCPGIPFAAPPAGAPPAPPFQCRPGLVGIGNVPAVIRQPAGKPSNIHNVHTPPAPTGRSLARSSASTVCNNGYSYGYLYRTHAVGQYATIQSLQETATNFLVTSPATDEHSIAGLFQWDNSLGEFVQLGFWRGRGPTGWNDTLTSTQMLVYLEFYTNGVYQWSPLFAANQTSRHDFKITQDATRHYYSLYVDGVLKWANVYLGTSTTRIVSVNEDYNVDGQCERAVSDNNSYSPSLVQIHVDSGHAVGVVTQNGPYASSQIDITAHLPEVNYQCGANPGRLYWWCAP